MPLALPPRPNLEWLRKTAKDRLVQLRTTQQHAKLADAQRGLAREYGFPSWRTFKAHIEQIAASSDAPESDRAVADFLKSVGTGRIDEVRTMLAATVNCPYAIDRIRRTVRPRPDQVAAGTSRVS